MRSYRKFWWAFPLISLLPFLALGQPASSQKQWNFKAKVQQKDADLATLPNALPEDPDAPPPPPKPKRRARAPVPTPDRETAPVPMPGEAQPLAEPPPPVADTDATAESPAPVTSSAGPSAADSLTPEQSVDIPMELEQPPVAEAPEGEPTEGEAPPADAPMEERVAEEAPLEPVEDSRAIISRRRAGRLYQPYYDQKPTYAVQLSGSRQALGEPFSFGGGDPAEFNVRGVSVAVDLQPKFLQHFGVIALGPTFTFYPFSITDPASSSNDATEGPLDVRAFGFSTKYQGKWFRGQKFVPLIGYEWQFARYRFLGDSGGGDLTVTTTLSGFTFGGMLQLQWLEHEAAFQAYEEWGMKRSYLIFETKTLSSAEGVLDTIGNSYWFGVRVEI